MVRARGFILLVLVSLVASLGLAVSPAAGAGTKTGVGKTATWSPAVNKGIPKAKPDPKPNSAPVKTMAAKPRPTAPIALTVQAPNPTTYGDTVQLTAVVNLAQVPTGGTLRFLDGGIQIGSPPVGGSGIAQMSTNTLKAAKHSFSATYTVGLNVSTSAGVVLTVAEAGLAPLPEPVPLDASGRCQEPLVDRRDRARQRG